MTNRPFDDAMIDRCCLYLLGEMPAAEADDFHRESAASVELQACLTQQAELISALGIALDAPRAAPAAPQPVTAATPRRFAGGVVAAALALAASLLLWVGLKQEGGLVSDDAPETMQLAHAWAAGRDAAETSEEWTGSRWQSEPWEEAELPLDSDGNAIELGLEVEAVAEEPGPPQWLIVAVRALEAESVESAESAEATESTESAKSTENPDASEGSDE